MDSLFKMLDSHDVTYNLMDSLNLCLASLLKVPFK